jgi:predicted TIM-barrel fold metal-dependent hydrolase
MGDLVNLSEKRRIVDAHSHFFDHKANRHDFLENVDEMFQALLGDYSKLPRTYLFDDYMVDAASVEVAGLVWYEFLSANPIREVQWAQKLADNLPIPMAIVGLVNFLEPDLEERLEAYTQCQNVTAVREHLGWDEGNRLRRFAKRGDLLRDSQWRHRLGLLRKYDFKCCLEVFSPQLPDLLAVIQQNPEIGFTIAVMGWPLVLDEQGRMQWKRDLVALSRCENACIEISANECILGMKWSLPEADPWVQTVFEVFGPARTMFGSHWPIAGLAGSFESLYAAYETMASRLSSSEQDAVFRRNASEWFGISALSGALVRRDS